LSFVSLGVIRFKTNKPTLSPTLLAKAAAGAASVYQRFGRATSLVSLRAIVVQINRSFAYLLNQALVSFACNCANRVFKAYQVLPLTGSDKIQRSQHRDSYVVGWQIINQFMNWFAHISLLVSR